MLTKEQRDRAEHLAAEWARSARLFGARQETAQRLTADFEAFSAYLDSITVPDKPLIYGCHCDLEPDMKPDGCVLDYGKPEDCVYAKILVKNGRSKEDCGYWKPIGDSND